MGTAEARTGQWVCRLDAEVGHRDITGDVVAAITDAG